jgi:hypothetical protein
MFPKTLSNLFASLSFDRLTGSHLICPKLCFFLFFVFLGNLQTAFAQKATLSGTIKDKKTGELLIGATISVDNSKPFVGTVTNVYGFYSLTLLKGEYTLSISFTGYETIKQKVTLDKNTTLVFDLSETTNELTEIVVTADAKEDKVQSAQMGMEKLDMKDLAKIPVLLGERDILKTIQLLPGIKSAGEGNSGFNVRGGSSDQNAIFLDEALVYNASHLLGFFSTFNADAIKDATVYKGGMPAQYGGRLSSVLDIRMKDGNDKKFQAGGGIGLIASRLNVEVPIVKDKGSLFLSGRRTYLDLFLQAAGNDNTIYFYDFNAKANYKINEKNRIFLSGYFGRDKLGVGSAFGLDWGNTTGTLRWNSVLNPKLFSNTSLIYSNYSYVIAINSNGNDFDITSRVRDYSLKQEFLYLPNPRHTMSFGVHSTHHSIVPGQVASRGDNVINVELQDRYAWENSFYVNDEWKVSPKININYGLRLTTFSLLGAGNFYSYDKAGKVTDTKSYASGEFVETYINPEPRLALSYIFNPNSSIKTSYTRNVQNLHLISNSNAGTPTDLWIPSSKNVKPEIADQFAVGYFRNIKDNEYEFNVEAYYKSMDNQIDYRDGASTRANDKIEGELLFGKGRAYGIEFLLRKKQGRLTGWVGYTLSRTEKQIEGINNGNWYAARQDRTHDISVVAMYDLSKKVNISATWVYNTGNAITFPNGKYDIADKVNFLYTERNSYRMPDYHRLDIGLTWIRKKTEKFESSWNFSLYNAYGRENAYTITFRQNADDASKTEAVRTALFRFVPAVTYNFKF